MSITTSNDFFINMKDPPRYDPFKHYYEQTKEVYDFYINEQEKITKGIHVDGIFIHPWLYFHANFFKTPIPISKDEEKLMVPPLRDNEWFFAENYQRAEENDRGLFMFGTRRYAKSSIIASVLHWKSITKPNSQATVSGGSTEDLEMLSKLLRVSNTSINPAFRVAFNKNDWDSEVEIGLKSKSNDPYIYSNIYVRNLSKGQDSASEKTAGASPSAFILDEAGKFNCSGPYEAALPSFETPHGWKCVPILTGTGGNEELSQDAYRMLTNPEAFKLLTMDWDTLENRIPDKSLITWKRKTFGIYVPAQMSYKTGIKKIPSNLGDYLGSEDKFLKSVDILVTDWKHSLEIIEADRELKKDDKIALNKETMYYPLDPDDCFLSRIDNPFPAKIALKHKTHLKDTGKIGKSVELYKKEDGTLAYSFSKKELAEYPFRGGAHDAPFLMFQDPPKQIPEYGEFVSGFDGYKQNVAMTDSLGAFYLFRRNVSLNEYAGRFVASYAARPNNMKTFHKNCEIAIEGWNAECLMENADGAFIQHLEDNFKADMLLAEGVDLSKSINPNSKPSTVFGLYPTDKNKAYLIQLFISYCWEKHVVGYDDDGLPIEILGVELIDDIYLLDEIIQYKHGNNVDRIVAASHALAWDRYLTTLNIVPAAVNPEIKKKKKRPGYRKGGAFSHRNYRSLKRRT